MANWVAALSDYIECCHYPDTSIPQTDEGMVTTHMPDAQWIVLRGEKGCLCNLHKGDNYEKESLRTIAEYFSGQCCIDTYLYSLIIYFEVEMSHRFKDDSEKGALPSRLFHVVTLTQEVRSGKAA